MRRTAALASLGVVSLLATVAAQAASSSTSAFGAPYGGFAAYHGTRLTTEPAKPRENKAIAYRGPKLQLAQAYVGRKAAEPTLGVDKKGSVWTVAAAFDAIPGNPPKNEPRTLVMRSTDGGRTFKDTSPNLAGLKTQNVSTDPYIYVEPTSGRVFDLDLQGLNGAHLSYSDDQGKTWTESLLTTAGANDHQTLVAGPAPEGVPLPLTDPKFQKVLYYCTNAVTWGSCARSFDGGHVFTQTNQTGFLTVQPNYLATLDLNHNEGICGQLHGHAVVDRAGRLFIPRGYCRIPMIAISNDAGTSFHDVKVADIPIDGQQASVAVDSKGTLYYAWYGGYKSPLPYLSISKDHGEHWSTPLMIAPPGVHEVNFPTIDVGDPGKIAITFPGTTSKGGTKDNSRPWNSYVVMSTNALSADPLFLSNIANPKNDPVARGDCSDRCGRMYDFLDIVSAPGDQGRVFATAVDTCTAVSSCNSKRVEGNDDDAGIVEEETNHPYGASSDMQGVIIREVSGPALRGSGWITRDTKR
ncbi:MAG TPA: sialidase family protein [Mycobacteriales bacterium]|nr:sialidase family protein [Mycobacteriales bacterium]